jgi:hypothetical protein
MNRKKSLSYILIGGIFLSGCELRLTGKAFDDYMKSFKPEIESWEKSEMTMESRLQD